MALVSLSLVELVSSLLEKDHKAPSMLERQNQEAPHLLAFHLACSVEDWIASPPSPSTLSIRHPSPRPSRFAASSNDGIRWYRSPTSFLGMLPVDSDHACCISGCSARSWPSEQNQQPRLSVALHQTELDRSLGINLTSV